MKQTNGDACQFRWRAPPEAIGAHRRPGRKGLRAPQTAKRFEVVNPRQYRKAL